MSELLKAVRLLGPSHMLKLGKGYRLGWDEMIHGYVATKSIHALLSVGFLDELRAKGSVNAEEFARTSNLDIDVLKPICEALYAMSLLDRAGEGYKLSPKGRTIMDVLRGWIEVSYGYSDVIADLDKMLTREMVYGKDFYRKSDYVATGSGEMENWLFFPIANEIILQKGYQRVMDLGCGDGTFLRKLCELNREVKCFGIDLAPAAIEEGERRARAVGLQDRIMLHAMDIQKVDEMPDPFKSVQATTIFFVLHEILYFGEDKLIDFLKAYRKGFPQVPLIVFEAIRPTAEEMRQRQGIAIYYYLYHDLTQQKPVSRERWKELFAIAGFASIEERYLPFARTAVYTLS